MTRNSGGRGLKSVEEEYKNIKIKAAVKLFENTDPAMAAVRKFEEKSERTNAIPLLTTRKDSPKSADYNSN